MDEKFIFDMILGSMLGDGHITKPCGKNIHPVMGFTQCGSKEKDYIEMKHKLCSSLYNVNKIRKGHYDTLRFDFSTKRDNENNLVAKIIELTRYEDNCRKIPDIKYITPVVLLFWYLDDGSLTIGTQKRPNGRKPSVYRKLRIALKSFKDEDIEIFIKKLNKKFGLSFKSFKENGKIVSIGISNNIEEIVKFLNIIYPYKDIVPKCMHYKFCLCYKKNRNLKYDYEIYRI